MDYELTNNSGQDLSELEEVIHNFLPFAQKYLKFDKPVRICLISDTENSKQAFAKTGYYSPSANEISVFVDHRHLKDILRSISHELIHHKQNCRGDFDRDMDTSPGYAQKNPHLRKLEKEAYLLGNILLRDFEDGLKLTKLSERLIKRWNN